MSGLSLVHSVHVIEDMAQTGFAFVGLDARSLANIELRVEVQRKMINIFAVTKVIPAGAKVLLFI